VRTRLASQVPLARSTYPQRDTAAGDRHRGFREPGVAALLVLSGSPARDPPAACGEGEEVHVREAEPSTARFSNGGRASTYDGDRRRRPLSVTLRVRLARGHAAFRVAGSRGQSAARTRRDVADPADETTVEEIVQVMRQAGTGVEGAWLRGAIVMLWRAGLRISEALAPAESDLDPECGAVLGRHGRLCRRITPVGKWITRDGSSHVVRASTISPTTVIRLLAGVIRAARRDHLGR
jgi:hypothetical protein